MNISAVIKNKKAKPIIFLLAFIIIAVIAYIILSNTILKDNGNEELPTIGNHGETMSGGKPFIMEPVEIKDVLSIKVDNEFGGFEFYLAEDGQYYFKDAEAFIYDVTSDWQNTDYSDLSDVISSMSMVDNLIGISRYMLATTEVTDFDSNHPEIYGLDNGGKASLTLTHKTKDGKEISETVRFGNLTTAGGGYYVALDGREALYVIADSGVTRCIFTDVKAYILPLVAQNISTNQYMDCSSFEFKKHGQTFISIEKLSDEEKEKEGNLYTHAIKYPDSYYPSSDMLESIFSTFTSFKGSKVVEFGINEMINDKDKFNDATKLFKLYSLLDKDNNWVNEISYKYDDLKIDSVIYLSEKLKVQNDESEQYIYYAYSPDMDIIVEFNANDLSWCDADLLDFLESHTYSIMINTVSSISFDYGTTHAKFTLTGDDNDLKVESSNGVEVETSNFRQLYKALLYATIEGYADVKEESTLLLSVKVELENGETSTYKFYGLTARKAYYTINDEGQFYVNRDYVKQLITACGNILEGKEVTVSEKV